MAHLVKKYMPYDWHKSYAYYDCSDCGTINDWNATKCQGCGKTLSATDDSVDREPVHSEPGPGDDDWLGVIF